MSNMNTVGSVTQSCLTLCDPMDCSMPGFPVHHQFLDMNTALQKYYKPVKTDFSNQMGALLLLSCLYHVHMMAVDEMIFR